MAKRGRGRPRKIASNSLSIERGDTCEIMVKSDDEEVPYSDNLPEFFKIYVPDLCSESMRIPPDFVKKFGGNLPTSVTLTITRQSVTMSWQVDLKRSIDEHWLFQNGWPRFVEENSLRRGDFMTFSYAGGSMFWVKIFARNGCTKRINASTSSNIIINDQSIGNINLKGHEADSHSPAEISNPGLRRNLRPRSTIATKCVCEIPPFSIMLMKSYKRKGSLHIPMKHWKVNMRKHESGSRMVTLRVKNKSWVVRLMIVEDKVVLSKGNWPKFIRDNSLRTGNLCTFKLIDSSSLDFEITVNK